MRTIDRFGDRAKPKLLNLANPETLRFYKITVNFNDYLPKLDPVDDILAECLPSSMESELCMYGSSVRRDRATEIKSRYQSRSAR